MMKVMIEVSLYPLMQDYIAPIQGFIDRINQYPDLEISTNSTSTQIQGDYLSTIEIVGKEMLRTHQEVGQAIFVCKFLNGDKMGNSDE